MTPIAPSAGPVAGPVPAVTPSALGAAGGGLAAAFAAHLDAPPNQDVPRARPEAEEAEPASEPEDVADAAAENVAPLPPPLADAAGFPGQVEAAGRPPAREAAASRVAAAQHRGAGGLGVEAPAVPALPAAAGDDPAPEGPAPAARPDQGATLPLRDGGAHDVVAVRPSSAGEAGARRWLAPDPGAEAPLEAVPADHVEDRGAPKQAASSADAVLRGVDGAMAAPRRAAEGGERTMTVDARALAPAQAGAGHGEAPSSVADSTAGENLIDSNPPLPSDGLHRAEGLFRLPANAAHSREAALRVEVAPAMAPPPGRQDPVARAAATASAPVRLGSAEAGAAGTQATRLAAADFAASPPTALGGAERLPAETPSAAWPAAVTADDAVAAAWAEAASRLAPAVRPEADALARGVARQVAEAMVAYRGAEAKIVLDPEELGPVRLTVILEDGGTLIRIVAERPETAELMRRHADLLLQDLAGSGVSQARLSFASGGETGGGEAGGGRDGGRQLPQPGRALESPAPGTPDHDIARRPDGRGLDMRV